MNNVRMLNVCLFSVIVLGWVLLIYLALKGFSPSKHDPGIAVCVREYMGCINSPTGTCVDDLTLCLNNSQGLPNYRRK